jgi:RNA polymerase sigma-70 factor (ECF subfamily)
LGGKIPPFFEYIPLLSTLSEWRMSTASQSVKTTSYDPAELIANHQVGVWRYLRAIGCDAAAADDLTQETFLAVLEKPFEHYNDAATASYLRRVAYNLLVSAKRKDKKLQVVEDVEEFDTCWEDWAGDSHGEERLEALNECLQALTERARWSLQMRFRDKLSRAEIAAALEITEHGAKNLMQRAKQQLKDCVDRKIK